MSDKKLDPLRRLEELPSLAYILLAVLALVIHVGVCTYTTASPSVVGLLLILLYAAGTLTVYFLFHRRLKRYRMEADAFESQREHIVKAFRDTVNFPYAVLTEAGTILAANEAMRRAAGIRDLAYGTSLTEILGIKPEQIRELAPSEDAPVEDDDTVSPADCEEETKETSLLDGMILSLGGSSYHPECIPLTMNEERFYLLALHDVTELSALSTLHHNTTSAIAYIVLDNLDELSQYVKVSYQNETRDVEAILRAWAASMGAMLIEYDRNKYVMLFSREKMQECQKSRFDVLDRIRHIRLGTSDTPITVSMGISILGNNMVEREKDALVALDMALLRGGDQVALKDESGTSFYGGRTKSPQKKSKTDSRVVLGELCSLIKSSPNVIIMGHSNPDFDSIGACVGLSVLARHLGVDSKIVMNQSSDSFRACTADLCELEDYKNIFVDGVSALNLSSYGTLLLIADANRRIILEAPELVKKSFKTAVVDHHILQDFDHATQLSYIDPTASSACELITEILEGILPEGALRVEEANVMMAGIMVDTHNFTRNVGPRTFSAALYLRQAGANTEHARTFFELDFEDYRSEAQFGSEARLYRDCIAITSMVGSGSANDRVSAAKAADRLLTVKGVDAAFALVLLNNMVHISARSNGNVNVQLVLEKIGGGGHFDVAGAAVKSPSLAEAESMLRKAIDKYFEENQSEDEE